MNNRKTTGKMIVLKVLKIIGSIILIIGAVLNFLYIIEKERKEEIEKYGMHICAGNSYGFCFALLVIAAILLVTL